MPPDGLQVRRLNLNTKSAQDMFDRDIFVLVVVTGLAFSLNVQGLMTLVEDHMPLISALRIVAYMFVLTSGGLIGLFSRRIACRITSWRDQR